MTMVSKTAIGIAAGIFGTLFVGYCVYFDRQRRKDPNFKKKLRERRIANKTKCPSKANNTKFPNIEDHEAMQQFFLHQVQLGEELLGQGDIEGGAEHLGNAVAVCGQPSQLLQLLQQTLPPNVFELLLQKIPAVSQRLREDAPAIAGGGKGAKLVEDDVE